MSLPGVRRYTDEGDHGEEHDGRGDIANTVDRPCIGDPAVIDGAALDAPETHADLAARRVAVEGLRGEFGIEVLREGGDDAAFDPIDHPACASLAVGRDDWHEQAVRSREGGLSYQAIGHAVGRSASTVREFLNPQFAQERLERKKRIRRSNRHALVEAGRNPIERSDDLAAARSYMRTDASARSKPSLPTFSMPAAIEDDRPAFRLAPKVRMTGSPGAERWRSIHLAMIRAGKIAPRGDLLSEIGR